MGATTIDGKGVSQTIIKEIKSEVAAIDGRKPGLAVILVGDDPASKVYVGRKQKTCDEIGFYSEKVALADSATENEVAAQIHRLNQDPKIDGILLQVPLPKHLNESELLRLINADKDVDGFHPLNVGKLMLGEPGFEPCTPSGVIELLKRYDLKSSGKHVVIIGRSNIVGKPQAALFLRSSDYGNATVTVCHSKTQNLKDVVRSADIVVAAIGRPEFVTADMIKPGAIVIDVGINRIEDATKSSGFRLVGDVEFEKTLDVAGWITPVPGGVGPMTIAMLMKNTLASHRNRS